jgi:hypothetical protein
LLSALVVPVGLVTQHFEIVGPTVYLLVLELITHPVAVLVLGIMAARPFKAQDFQEVQAEVVLQEIQKPAVLVLQV